MYFARFGYSKILGLSARQLPENWLHRYGLRPLLLETFFEKDCFSGACYREANWLHVGQTPKAMVNRYCQ